MFEGIDKALGVPSSEAPAESKPLTVAVPTEGIVLSQERIDADLRLDYDSVRKNLKELVESGKVALDGIINVAQEGDSPRAYEVVAQLIKTLSDTNKDLLEMHTKVKAIRKSETTVNNVNNTTQSIYLGSTKDLQDIINAARSTTKAFDNRPDVLEAIVEDNSNEQ
jgi:predicted RNase H-like HicB family nuclease